jgi:hypothetical protein
MPQILAASVKTNSIYFYRLRDLSEALKNKFEEDARTNTNTNVIHYFHRRIIFHSTKFF